MLAITNSVTPQKLNQRFKLPLPPKIGVEKKDQVLQTHEQMTRPKHTVYQNQTAGLKHALLQG